jgi:riboflavin biosynthesis pyrimidine reductase
MSSPQKASPDATDSANEPGVEEPRLQWLLPPAADATAAEIVEQMGLWERPARGQRGSARVLLNMVSSADGRATMSGRSAPLSSAADRALFHALRTAVDAVLVGAGTVRTERYGRLIRDEQRRSQRIARGFSEEPLACIVSGRLALDPEIPLLADPSARVAILTASQASLPGAAASIEYVRCGHNGVLDLAAALAELHERNGVELVLCEGGPHLASQLLAAGLLDELFLSLSPALAGGEPAGGEALRIIAGSELDPPVGLELLAALREGSYLFLRYGVSAR